MRNSVIRKKRLKAERIVDDYMRMPQRILTGATDIILDEPQFHLTTGRLWAIEEPRFGVVPALRRSAITNRYVTAKGN